MSFFFSLLLAFYFSGSLFHWEHHATCIATCHWHTQLLVLTSSLSRTLLVTGLWCEGHHISPYQAKGERGIIKASRAYKSLFVDIKQSNRDTHERSHLEKRSWKYFEKKMKSFLHTNEKQRLYFCVIFVLTCLCHQVNVSKQKRWRCVTSQLQLWWSSVFSWCIFFSHPPRYCDDLCYISHERVQWLWVIKSGAVSFLALSHTNTQREREIHQLAIW